MATKIFADDVEPLRYSECPWGDLIEGTKEQLQALGLGIDMAFPGEAGGPTRNLKTRDPRGFEVRISNIHRRDGRFTAFLIFPNWPKRPDGSENWESFAPGVEVNKRYWVDEFVGHPEALAAAELLRLDQLPGQPGMRKVRVSILPDGTVPKGAPTANHRVMDIPGARIIERVSTSAFRVSVVVSKEEAERRLAMHNEAHAEWERRVSTLCRPPRLQARQNGYPHPAAPRPAHATYETQDDSLETMFRIIVRKMGLLELARRVDCLQRAQRPVRSVDYLRIVWNASDRDQPRVQ